MTLALDHRTGLPDALKVLLHQYPREIWQSHPNFDGLTQFWLSRHLEFRRALGMMRDHVTAIDDQRIDPDQGSKHLLRIADFFLQSLHGHHHIEDTAYFPIFTEKDARLSPGFDLLDADHHRLHEELDRMERGAGKIVGALQNRASPDEAVKRFGDILATFDPFLDRHLLDEEDLVVPIILEHGSPHV